jgi:hypothetical protein
VALPTGAKHEEKGVGEIATDLWILCRDYAKQETIDPLKSIGRFLGWGVAGSLVLSMGLLFGALAVLRALQTETGDALTGSLNWVPYLAALVFALVSVGLAVLAIRRPVRAEEKQQR